MFIFFSFELILIGIAFFNVLAALPEELKSLIISRRDVIPFRY